MPSDAPGAPGIVHIQRPWRRARANNQRSFRPSPRSVLPLFRGARDVSGWMEHAEPLLSLGLGPSGVLLRTGRTCADPSSASGWSSLGKCDWKSRHTSLSMEDAPGAEERPGPCDCLTTLRLPLHRGRRPRGLAGPRTLSRQHVGQPSRRSCPAGYSVMSSCARPRVGAPSRGPALQRSPAVARVKGSLVKRAIPGFAGGGKKWNTRGWRQPRILKNQTFSTAIRCRISLL